MKILGTEYLNGFTIENPTGFGLPQNVNVINVKGHGVACAEIIGATNNAIGIRGVASNVNILPINIVPYPAIVRWDGFIDFGFGSNIEIAEAIHWAWRRADILSCS